MSHSGPRPQQCGGTVGVVFFVIVIVIVVPFPLVVVGTALRLVRKSISQSK